MQQKREILLDKQGRALKLLGLYTGVILLIFAIFIPFLDPARNVVTGTGVVTQSPVSQNSPPDSILVPIPTSEKKAVTSPVPVTQTHSSTVLTSTAEEKVDNSPVPVTQKPAADLKKMVWPIKGQVLQQFGMTYSRTYSDYRFHNGIDIQVSRGSEIVAVLPGKVVKIDTDKSQLTAIVLDHGSGWQSVYSHLEDSFVKEGADIKGGQALGSVGQPGLSEVLDGPHLHFTLVKNGREVNPLDYLPQ